MLVVSYGGGTNSTAMLIQMWNVGLIPEVILFADTGGEKPHTYCYVETLSRWLFERGFPKIITVKKGGNGRTLEEDCRIKNMLPSLAYGFKSCSHKFKIQPQEKWLNNYEPAKELWKTGEKVTKAIGYDMDEPHRASIPEDKKYKYIYPLRDWNWGRKECEKAILDAGLELPGKSACFFCPATRPTEIKELEAQYPDLLQRALDMESAAMPNLDTVVGLGRSFKWADVVRQDDLFGYEKYAELTPRCGCYDG